MAVTREELYQQVWSAPMRGVAAPHGVSGSFLARICWRINFPCPLTGYWAKIAAGQSPPEQALTPATEWRTLVTQGTPNGLRTPGTAPAVLPREVARC